MANTTYTIDRVRFVGKWVEYWFQDCVVITPDTYHFSSKSNKFWDCIETAGLYDHVISYGANGLHMTWKQIGCNYEPVAIFKTSQEELATHCID